jgi:hypothetical protein
MSKSAEQVPERLQLTIAGIGIELTWEGARLLEEPARKFYQGFLSNGSHRDPDVRLHLRCSELPHAEPEAMIFDAVESHWRLFRANGRYVFEFFDTKLPHPLVQLAFMAPDFSAGECYVLPRKRSPKRSWLLTRLMRPFGELLLVNLLSQDRGVLIHGLAVKDQGEGLLFIGHSGAGKTTLANLYKPFEGATILGDERVVVTKTGGQFWLSGTPWPGEAFTVSPETVPLRRMFFLEHGTRNEFISDRLINLYGLFLQQIFLPFWNGKALAHALAFGEELLTTVPASRLAFVNDARVIEFLRRQGQHGSPT